MLFNREWEKTESRGLVEAHAYFIPFKDSDTALSRENSSLFTSLNGDWSLKAFKDVSEVETVDEKLPDVVPVPSCLQMLGYDEPQYTNVQYPFPYAPPKILKDNPAFHYRRTFTVDDTRGVHIVFEGVDSFFYLYINGVRVGYSQISHKVAEFDIEKYLVKGENTVDVFVLKYCAGSYLEDQDKWRFTGIFRDVYLLKRAALGLTDYRVETDIAGTDGIVKLTAFAASPVAVTFEGTTQTIKNGETAVFTVKNVKPWSAEVPTLYPMVLSCAGEIVYEEVGVRTVGIENGVFKVNGKAIKLHGVNRHDFHPDKGAAVSTADIERDLKLMKSLNVNAVRTSHYPSAPEFYKLCDRLGLYVMSESDVEAHGTVTKGGGYEIEFVNEIAESDLFTDAIFERNTVNVKTNRNRPCVLVWSLGNESGYGKNFVAAAEWIHANDSRPVHYEQHFNVYTGRENDPVYKERYYTDPIDMVSRMYPAIEDMHDKLLGDPKETRPIVLCEYCHAMGNGPGDLKDYWAEMNSSDRYMGGFVWEWADHGLCYKGKKHLYGDDFPNMNDGNFCVDGIVSPERDIKPGTEEMKAVYADVQFVKSDDGVRIFNGYFFKTIKGTVTATVKCSCGKTAQVTTAVELNPREGAKVNLPALEGKGFVGLYLTFDGNAEANGYFTLQEQCGLECKPTKATVSKSAAGLTLSDGKTTVTVDRKGKVTALEKGGKNILTAPIEVEVVRAPIDNDRYVRDRWKNVGILSCEMFSEVTAESGRIVAKGSMVRDARRNLLDYTLNFCLTDKGLQIDFEYAVPDYIFDLPRIGLKFAIADHGEKVEYRAYEGESYIDRHAAYAKDVFTKSPDELYTPYIKPQENGSRYDADYVALIGKTALKATADRQFSFSVLPYSREQLTTAAHDTELVKDGNLYVHLDARMEGVGSNSCGPQLAKQYRINGGEKGKILFVIG